MGSPWTRSVAVVHGLGVSEMYRPELGTQEYNIVYLTKPKRVVFAHGQSAVSFREESLQRNSCSPDTSLSRSSQSEPEEVQVLQAPVVERLDNAIHRINRYPADKC